jgi:hypothetical protein
LGEEFHAALDMGSLNAIRQSTAARSIHRSPYVRVELRDQVVYVLAVTHERRRPLYWHPLAT